MSNITNQELKGYFELNLLTEFKFKLSSETVFLQEAFEMLRFYLKLASFSAGNTKQLFVLFVFTINIPLFIFTMGFFVGFFCLFFDVLC